MKRAKGFTLFETLITLTLTSVLITLVYFVFFRFVEFSKKTDEVQGDFYEAVLQDKMSRKAKEDSLRKEVGFEEVVGSGD